MGNKAEETPRICHRESNKTPVFLGYPPSDLKKNSTLEGPRTAAIQCLQTKKIIWSMHSNRVQNCQRVVSVRRNFLRSGKMQSCTHTVPCESVSCCSVVYSEIELDERNECVLLLKKFTEKKREHTKIITLTNQNSRCHRRPVVKSCKHF